MTTGIGQRFGPAVMDKGQFVMVESKLMQQRRMQVVNADPAFHRSITNFVSGAMDVTRFESTASKQQAESVTIVVTP